MASLRISELTQRTPDGTEFIEVIIPPFTPGTNRKVLLQDILDLVPGGTGSIDSVTGDGVDNTDPDNPVLNNSQLDLVASAIVTTTLTLNINSQRERNFDLTTTASGNFTIAFSNNSNHVRSKLFLRVTGAIVITMPSAVIMDLFEKSVARWDDATNQLTLTGVTASPFMLTFDEDASGNVWCHASNRGV
jgi:hypothetical protein